MASLWWVELELKKKPLERKARTYCYAVLAETGDAAIGLARTRYSRDIPAYLADIEVETAEAYGDAVISQGVRTRS